MSIERPNSSPESPEEKYQKLLLAGVETSKKYEQLSESLNQEEDESLAYEDTEEAVHDLAQQMESEMKERVNILRQSGTTNIESVFPRAKRNEEAEEANRQLGELQREMTEKLMKGMSDPRFDMSELNEMRDRAQELMAKSQFQEMTEQEAEQFDAALKKLAEDNGYEFEGGSLGGWVTVKKGGIEFQMKHYVVPSEHGISGYSRISKMGVYRKTESGDNEWLLNYDRGWDVANKDPEIQKEIDRVVAIFG